MIEKDKIKWIEEPDGRTQIHYKGVKLDLPQETIQDIHHGLLYSEREIEIIIYDSYQKNLRIHRENKLKQILDFNK